jgi:hypothetical protein
MKFLIRNKNILKGRLPGCKILKIVLYTENSWIFWKLMCFCSWIYTYHLQSPIGFKCLGTDATKTLNLNKRRSPTPPIQCCVPFFVRFYAGVLVFELRKQQWLGWGIVCNKLYRSIYNLKLHVPQQLLKVIVVTCYAAAKIARPSSRNRTCDRSRCPKYRMMEI